MERMNGALHLGCVVYEQSIWQCRIKAAKSKHPPDFLYFSFFDNNMGICFTKHCGKINVDGNCD